MKSARRRWVLQNLVLPMVPWVLGIGVAGFVLQRPEWQLLGISIYAITMALIAFYMGATIGNITLIIEGEFDPKEVVNRSQLWYLCGALYAVIFTLYDGLTINGVVHHWLWGRVIDIAIICLGGVTLMKAYFTCAYLKLDTR